MPLIPFFIHKNQKKFIHFSINFSNPSPSIGWLEIDRFIIYNGSKVI